MGEFVIAAQASDTKFPINVYSFQQMHAFQTGYLPLFFLPTSVSAQSSLVEPSWLVFSYFHLATCTAHCLQCIVERITLTCVSFFLSPSVRSMSVVQGTGWGF